MSNTWEEFGWPDDDLAPPYPWVERGNMDGGDAVFRHFTPGNGFPTQALARSHFYQQWEREIEYNWFALRGDEPERLHSPLCVLEIDFSDIPGWSDGVPQAVVPAHDKDYVVPSGQSGIYEGVSYSSATIANGYSYDNPAWVCPTPWVWMRFFGEVVGSDQRIAPGDVVYEIADDPVDLRIDDVGLLPFRTQGRNMTELGGPGTWHLIDMAIDQRWPYGIGARKWVPFRWSPDRPVIGGGQGHSVVDIVRVYSGGESGEDVEAVKFRLFFPTGPFGGGQGSASLAGVSRGQALG